MKPHKILTQKELRKRFAKMAMMDAKELGCPFSYFYDKSYSTFARSKSKKKGWDVMIIPQKFKKIPF